MVEGTIAELWRTAERNVARGDIVRVLRGRWSGMLEGIGPAERN